MLDHETIPPAFRDLLEEVEVCAAAEAWARETDETNVARRQQCEAQMEAARSAAWAWVVRHSLLIGLDVPWADLVDPPMDPEARRRILYPGSPTPNNDADHERQGARQDGA